MPKHDPNGLSHEDRARHFAFTEASEGFDYDAVERGLSSKDERATESRLDIFAATLRCMIVDIENAGTNAAREATYHRLAIGIRLDDHESMRSVARAWGITVEAVSKRVKEIRDRHALAVNSFNKTDAAAALYRETNKRRT